MSERMVKILQELAGLYDQQRRFVTPKPSDEQVEFRILQGQYVGQRGDRPRPLHLPQ